jgi:hypothetical protein
VRQLQPPAQPPTAEGSGRKRRTAAQKWGTESTRASTRTKKPSEKSAAASFFTAIFPDWEENEEPRELETFSSIFMTAVKGLHNPAQQQLRRVPQKYSDLDRHPMGKEFKEACRKELRDLLKRGTWRLIDRCKTNGRILPLKWVFSYKTDENNNLVRCKARICVRGDLQDDTLGETYAATLATKSFRTIMATAARFDLECDQYDVVNAFLNSKINRDGGNIYVKLPDGYQELGFLHPGEDATMAAELDKALYGLRESPLLWYNEFSSALEEFGLKRSLEEPCVFTSDRVVVLFYVDDILVLYRKEDKSYAQKLVDNLRTRYELRDEGEVKWFLGIRVTRDRTARKIYLSHDSYIERMAKRFELHSDNLRLPSIPIPTDPMTRFESQASQESIRTYQEKIGSILYTAVTIRPDVARAASQISRYLTNPSPEHHSAADQTIRYLYGTRFLSIEYNGEHKDALVIASDASFADDEETRRSSQGYVMMLFGGAVAWKASQQDTVTTSTTEAELLGVERTTKEAYALARFMKDIKLDLGQPLRVFCDNTQTIRLVVDENQRISTRLRHVDIQNMWLKQEYRKGNFLLEYLPTARMPADGLTKALSRQKFEHFRSLLNLRDIQREVEWTQGAS